MLRAPRRSRSSQGRGRPPWLGEPLSWEYWGLIESYQTIGIKPTIQDLHCHLLKIELNRSNHLKTNVWTKCWYKDRKHHTSGGAANQYQTSYRRFISMLLVLSVCTTLGRCEPPSLYQVARQHRDSGRPAKRWSPFMCGRSPASGSTMNKESWHNGELVPWANVSLASISSQQISVSIAYYQSFHNYLTQDDTNQKEEWHRHWGNVYSIICCWFGCGQDWFYCVGYREIFRQTMIWLLFVILLFNVRKSPLWICRFWISLFASPWFWPVSSCSYTSHWADIYKALVK